MPVSSALCIFCLVLNMNQFPILYIFKLFEVLGFGWVVLPGEGVLAMGRSANIESSKLLILLVALWVESLKVRVLRWKNKKYPS